MTSKMPTKVPLRGPKIDREWTTTLILVSVATLLVVALAVVVTARYFELDHRGLKRCEMQYLKGYS